MKNKYKGLAYQWYPRNQAKQKSKQKNTTHPTNERKQKRLTRPTTTPIKPHQSTIASGDGRSLLS